MSKEGKRIKKWKSAGTLGEVYLKDMAEQGFILEEMTALQYIFREDEPRHLRYRIEEREHLLTDAERAEYAKEGWQEVCRYELDYVFAREGSADEPEVSQETILKDLDTQMQQEKESIRQNKIGLLLVPIVLAVCVLAKGRLSADTFLILLRYVVPVVVISFGGAYLRIRKLRSLKERTQDGDIPQEYTNWRKNRAATAFLIFVCVVGLGAFVFYEGDFNDKTFDLPTEISYAAVPAVRLEQLIDAPLTRCGDSIDPSQEGFHMNTDTVGGIVYQSQKRMGALYNYGVAHRFEPRTKENLETKQYMQSEDGEEFRLKTQYRSFRFEKDAKQAYQSGVEEESASEKRWQEEESDFPSAEEILGDSTLYADVHACRTDWGKSVSYHLLYRDGERLMELQYNGQDLDPEQLLTETERVFAAQEDKK